MFRIRFENLGRNKATFEEIVEEAPTYHVMRGWAGLHLASSEIDFLVTEESHGTAKGRVIVGGFRPVGHFTITECV